MLRRLLGIAAGVAVLSAVPVSFHAPEAGGVPVPVLSDLSCTEDATCCPQVNSICLATGDPVPDHADPKGDRCR